MIVLFGRHRWRRRRAIARLGLAETDAFGRPSFLYLTDTHRKRRQIARDFEGRDTFEPPARVIGDLLSELWARWGDGRAVLTERQISLKALPLVKAGPLSAHGEPHRTALQLARLLTASLEAGVTPTLDPGAKEAFEALRRSCQNDQRVLAPTATRALTTLFRRPPAGLDRWITGLPPLIVDDILQPTPTRTQALLPLLEAGDDRGRSVVIAFESGSALDSSEVAAFLGAAEQTPRAHKAFAATHRLRMSVFERFIASGRAGLVLARADGPVQFDLHSPANAPDEPDLVDLLHGEAPIPADALHDIPVAIRSHASEAAEIASVLGEVRRQLEAGTDPRDCMVAHPDLKRVRHTLDATAHRLGVPLAVAEPLRLMDSPLGRALGLMVMLALEAGSPADWLDLGDLLGLDVEGLLHALPGAGVRGGAPESWEGPVRAWAIRTSRDPDAYLAEIDAMGSLHTHVASLRSTRSPEDWVRCLIALPLPRGNSAVSLAAAGAFACALDELLPDLAGQDWASEDLLPILLQLTRTTNVPSPPTTGVTVTGLLELRGLTPRHCWVMGLTRRRFPASWAPSSLIGPTDQYRLAPLDRLAEARYLLGSLARNALGDPGVESLVLSWPRLVGGRVSSPSVVLAEWLQRELAGDFRARRTVGELWVASLDDPPPQSRRPSEPIGVGALGRPLALAGLPRLSVTAAETALRCPAAFWYRYSLGLDPADPWDPELEPRRRGTALHAMLQRFYEERNFEVPTGATRERDARQLHEIASSELDSVEATGGFEPALQAWARSRWLAGLIDPAPRGLLAAWLETEIAGERAPQAVERPVRLRVGRFTLTGTVDRVDQLPGGAALVTDYKTGQPPSRSRVEAGLALQPLVYVEATSEELRGPVASAFQVLARPDAIRRSGWYGDPDAVVAWGGTRALAATHQERVSRLEEVEERLTEVVDGAVHTTVWGPELAGCQYCRFRRVCRVEHGGERC